MTISSVNSNYSRYAGIAYTIKNSKGVTSILMATCHLIDPHTLQNPCFQKILKCSMLFTEMGTDIPFNANDGCFPGTEKHDVPYPHSVDGFLTIMAALQNTPIVSLDSGVQNKKRQNEIAEIKALREQMGGVAFSEFIAKSIKNIKKPLLDEITPTISAFRRGDLNKIKIIREEAMSNPVEKFLMENREEQWLKTLIPVLQKTDKPVGIAIGAIHAVGKNSLSEQFAKAGFQVRLIAPKRLFSRL